jgi:hypothetical protein
MPRPKTGTYWAHRVQTLASDGLRAPAIARRLAGEGRPNYPTERTVRRLIEEYAALPDHLRLEQALFRWPASMDSGALPWEAGRAALELLRFCDEHGLPLPTNSQATWFWRLRLTSPARDATDLHQAATLLALGEGAPESLQWDLAYDGAPRPSEVVGEEAQRYLDATIGPGALADIQRRLAERAGQSPPASEDKLEG